MARIDDRTLTRALAGSRAAIGVVLLVAPGLAARWLTDDARKPAMKSLVRGLAGRDLALGVGTLLAVDHDKPVRGWLEAGMLADASDAIGALLAWRGLPRGRRLAIASTATGAVVLGRRLAVTAG